MTTNQPRTALVTGGAQRIGRSLTEALAEAGWAVAIHCRESDDAATELASRINSNGGRAVVCQGDLSDEAQTQDIFDKAQGEIGPITALINNASVFEAEDWNDVTANSWALHFNVNLRAPFLLSQLFARSLPESMTGSIVNIIDQRVLNLNPHYISYTLSKAALWTLTQTFAMALAPNIRVNAIGPGPTLPNPRQSNESFLQQAQATPLERPVAIDDITAAMCYLLNASSVTGQLIAVDSGEHLGWAQPEKGKTFDG